MRKKVCSELSTTLPNSQETCEHFVSSHSHYRQALQHRRKEASMLRTPTKNKRKVKMRHGVGDLQKGSPEGDFPDLF